jgi:SAM-dependent methyltransferase
LRRCPRATEAPLSTTGAEQPSYDSTFFKALEEGVARSAEIATELVMELIAPKSAVDIGCGTGIWLAELGSRGVTDILGVDGPWVPRDQLAIPESRFLEHDLTRPLAIDRGFDLALCLETAEHLPAEAAEPLVRTLTGAAPVVLFSAAIPEQRGEGHINLQWPQYWIDLFAARGYRCSTVLRERLWNAEAVEVWYRQNLLCFAAEKMVRRLPEIFASEARPGGGPVDIVHPGLFLHMSGNLREYARYAEHLKGELQRSESELRSAETQLRSIENELRSVGDELRHIKSTRAYRLYARLQPALAAADRLVRKMRRR